MEELAVDVKISVTLPLLTKKIRKRLCRKSLRKFPFKTNFSSMKTERKDPWSPIGRRASLVAFKIPAGSSVGRGPAVRVKIRILRRWRGDPEDRWRLHVEWKLLKTVGRTWRLWPGFIPATAVNPGTRCLVFHPGTEHIAGSSILPGSREFYIAPSGCSYPEYPGVLPYLLRPRYFVEYSPRNSLSLSLGTALPSLESLHGENF